MYKLFTLLLLLPGLAGAQSPVLYWGHAFSGPGNLSNYINSCRAVTTDADGKVYTVGEFANNLDMDPSPATAMVSSGSQTNFDMFLACYDSTGAYLWSKRVETGASCFADHMHRQPSGDLVMAGYLQGTTDFDPGPGTAYLTGTADLFFARYTPLGDLVWAKTFGSVSGVDELHAMSVDAVGNIWIAGAYNDTIDLDPGLGQALFPCTPASRDGFFAKYDANGVFQWGHAFGNSWSDEAKAIAFDAAGNAVITGYFRTSIDVEPGPGITTLNQLGTGDDAFVATYSSTGQLLDAFVFGGQASDMEPACIAVDDAGAILVAGGLYGNQASLTPGQVIGTINAGSNTYGWLAKYDAAGTLLWGQVMPCSGSSGPKFKRMALDSNDDVHLTGEHTNPFDADPTAATLTLSSYGAYLLKYASATGWLNWAVPMGSASSQYSNGIHIDAGDHIYIAGGGNSAWTFNGAYFGGGNNATLLKTGECLPTAVMWPLPFPTEVCEGDSLDMVVMASGTAIHYQWSVDGSPSGMDLPAFNTGPLLLGVHEIQCTVTGLCGVDSVEATITSVGRPDPIIIEMSGVLNCQEIGDTYIWYLNGQPILGAGNSTYIPVQNGTYTVTVINQLACATTSPPYYYGGIGVLETTNGSLRVEHVPGTEMVRVSGLRGGEGIELWDVTGKRIRNTKATDQVTFLPLNGLSSGLYLVKVEGRTWRVVR